MKEKQSEELLEFLNNQDIPSAEYLGDWNRHKVFKPDLAKFGLYIGTPTYIPEKGTELRLTDNSEGMAIFDWYLAIKGYTDDNEMQPLTEITDLNNKK